MNELRKDTFYLEMDHELLIYGGQTIKTTEHTHFLVSLVLSENEPFLIKRNGTVVASKCCLLPANYTHAFESCSDEKVIFIYLEADCMYPHLFKAQFELKDDMILLDHKKYATQLSQLFSKPLTSILAAREFINSIIEVEPTSQIDDRILKACQWIVQHLDEKIAINELAKKVFLSNSRLRNLFKQELGITISKYIRWKRLKRAGQQLIQGDNFTQATYSAGFYDSAHFNKSFKELFGVTPFNVLK